MSAVVQLIPLPDLSRSPAPWSATDDGTVVDRDGRHVCVLGSPFEELEEQDVTNGVLIVLAPQLVRAAAALLALVQADRPGCEAVEEMADLLDTIGAAA